MANAVISFAFLLSWFALYAAPFWQTKPPAQWDDRELLEMLTDSPWAQMAQGPGKVSPAAPVLIFFATAAPMKIAERERDRRAQLKLPLAKRSSEPDPLVEEYRAWLEENRAGQIVVAVLIPNTAAFSDQREVRKMEDESTLQVGRRKLKMTGHFPPSAGDPYLRLAFPRQVALSDKSIVLDLYLPGIPSPYRQAQFTVKDMVVDGKLEL
jgi:hypothetical protein